MKPPGYCFQGCLFGDKLMYPIGMSFIWSTASKHISVLKFGLNLAKGNDFVEGNVYHVSD
jgi:hypothetical protein